MRRIDRQRRITLPLDIIDYGWTENTPLTLTLMQSQMLIIAVRVPFCRFCGSEKGPIIPVDEHYICKKCLQTAMDNESTILAQGNKR
jgi:transposase-like protein